MNILVTGGAGYIGSHTAKALKKSGHTPIAYDNLSKGHRWAVQWGPFVCGDIGDEALVKATVRRYAIGAVLHFAGDAYVGESMIRPDKYFENNAVKSFQLIRAVREAGVRYFVLSSTCATYGFPTSLPIPEDHPQVPLNPYGDSKLFVERMLKWYGQAFDLRWIALRYFNAAGADPDGDLGECHNPETHILPLALEALLSPSQPVYIFGDDYATKDGTAVRDYIHVSDLADGHVAALNYLLDGGNSEAFNLGSGVGHSVTELLTCVAEETGLVPPSIRTGRRAGDPPALIADSHSACTKLGWKAQNSSLAQIVGDAWRWHNALLEKRPLVASGSGD